MYDFDINPQAGERFEETAATPIVAAAVGWEL